jgi:hypothetical protein
MSYPYLSQLQNPVRYPQPPSLTGITAALWGIFVMLLVIAATMIVGAVMLFRALGPLFDLYNLMGR